MPVLDVGDLVVHFGSAAGALGRWSERKSHAIKAVDGISFSIARGEMFGLVGESGCGKSTTGAAVLRLLDGHSFKQRSGTITFEGADLGLLTKKDLRGQRRNMQIVYQDPYESLDPRCRVSQVLTEPLRVHGLGGSNEARRRMIREVLEKVELTPPDRYLDRYPHELSGGQRQRVAIAAAIVLSPQLLVADEPVSMLDVSIRAGVMSLVKRLCVEDGMAVLMISHDLAVIARFADRIGVMYLGRIVESGEALEVLRHPAHPYTKALCEAIPKRGRSLTDGGYELLGGEPPNAAAVPSGCRFHPRCPVAIDLCRVQDPRLEAFEDAGSSHLAACHLVSKPVAIAGPDR